jgi:hypothetical protein
MLGCASSQTIPTSVSEKEKPVTLNEKTQCLAVPQESVAFMTLKVSNRYKPKYQPFVESMTVWYDSGDKFRFTVDKPYSDVTHEYYNEYLITMCLPPGSYKIGRFYGFSRNGIGNPYGTFYIPVFSDFELKQSQIVYLGHIEATVHRRSKDDDLMAGPAIPLLDQVATGFLRGTFDTKISDNFDGDIVIFEQKYSSIGNAPIEKQILPPWKRPTRGDIFQDQVVKSAENIQATTINQIIQALKSTSSQIKTEVIASTSSTPPKEPDTIQKRETAIEKTKEAKVIRGEAPSEKPKLPPDHSMQRDKWNAPVWNIGDSWKFRFEDNSEWKETVEGIEEDIYIVRSTYEASKPCRDKKTLRTVAYLTPKGRKTKSTNGVILYFDFPLYVGKKWDTTITARPSYLPREHNFLLEYEVMSYENVTVPAGTFKAYKIELKQTNITTNIGYEWLSKAYIWYSPEIKFYVKVIYEKTDYWVSPVKDFQLVSYNLKGSQPSLPETQLPPNKGIDITQKPQPSLPQKAQTPSESVPPLAAKPQTFTPATLPPITPPPTVNKVVVTGMYANIRSGAGNEFPIVTTVKQGDKLILLGEYGDWYAVKLESGQEGWINNRFAK